MNTVMSKELNTTTTEPRLDEDEAVSHSAANQTKERYEEANDHLHGYEEGVRRLYESAARLAGGRFAFHIGGQQSEFAAAREAELEILEREPSGNAPATDPDFVGGEHQVFLRHPPVGVFKQTLPGFYGRILDEKMLLDPRTFLNVRRLAMRGALPSEYVLRWAVTQDVFGLQTDYLGIVQPAGEEPEMAVGQAFITENPDDPATLEDVAALFEAHGFARVDSKLIVNPEIQEVTWYRQRDGLLITDAHARNFRKDLSGLLIPIDLVITVIPSGACTILPQPDAQWQPSYLKNERKN